jgi:hypothetical protein
MDPRIADFIREHRQKLTREAIRQQLMEAGYSPEAIDGTWDSLAESEPMASGGPVIPGWRPGWRVYLILVVLGTTGAFLVWRDESYVDGPTAALVYLVLASGAFGVGKAASIRIDRGERLGGALLIGLVVAGVVALALWPSLPPDLAIGPAVVVGLAAGLVTTLLTDARAVGVIGAAAPLVAWLAITGTCYTPLISQLVP